MRRDKPRIPVAPILEHLGVHVPPARGGYSKVVCRWHDDSTPSASASEYGFRCFSCGKTGDAIKLLMDEEGMSFADALKTAEELAGSAGHGVAETPQWGGSLFAS